jgi:hypothetical protein
MHDVLHFLYSISIIASIRRKTSGTNANTDTFVFSENAPIAFPNYWVSKLETEVRQYSILNLALSVTNFKTRMVHAHSIVAIVDRIQCCKKTMRSQVTRFGISHTVVCSSPRRQSLTRHFTYHAWLTRGSGSVHHSPLPNLSLPTSIAFPN